MSIDTLRRLGLIALLVMVALSPAACGVKGDPELPPGESDEFPRKYPSEDDT